MIRLFTKPVQDLNAGDIEEIVRERIAEGPQLEFKQTLPDKRGNTNPWIAGRGEIGEYARDEILSEVIALANTQGGFVVLGIAETDDKPPKARSIEALPRIGDLASRLEDHARSCIDVPVSRLQVVPINTAGEGCGVVVIHAPGSRLAPHRLTTTGECYIRRGSSSVKMTMREIKESVLASAREQVGIDALFNQRRENFQRWAPNRSGPSAALRVTAIPVDELPDPGRIFGQARLYARPSKTHQLVVDGLKMPVSTILRADAVDPIIRGVAYRRDADFVAVRLEQYQAGIIDLWFNVRMRRARSGVDELMLLHDWVLAAVLLVLDTVNVFRTVVAAPNAEYGLEIEIAGLGVGLPTPIHYYDLNEQSVHDLTNVPLLLPRLSIGDETEFGPLIKSIDTDIFDHLGAHRELREFGVELAN